MILKGEIVGLIRLFFEKSGNVAMLLWRLGHFQQGNGARAGLTVCLFLIAFWTVLAKYGARIFTRPPPRRLLCVFHTCQRRPESRLNLAA